MPNLGIILAIPATLHQGRNTGNNRNSYSTKKYKGDHGTIEIETPRDRNASIEPELVAKGQTRITSNDAFGNNMPYNIRC